MYPAPIIPTLIRSIHRVLLALLSYKVRFAFERSFHRCPCFASEIERIAHPVFRSEYFDARYAVVTDATQRRDDLLERQDAESGQQPVSVFEPIAREVFSCFIAREVDPAGAWRIELFDCGAVGVGVKAVKNQS